MILINAEKLYEKTAELEAQALHMVEKSIHDEDLSEWRKWSAILNERTAFKYDIEDAPIVEERKTGHWVEVHGYATPGGDPVWACSECGKGQHVYGIEHGTYGKDVSDGQWVTCPNCGTVMEE